MCECEVLFALTKINFSLPFPMVAYFLPPSLSPSLSLFLSLSLSLPPSLSPPPQLRQLVAACISPNPDDRPDITQLSEMAQRMHRATMIRAPLASQPHLTPPMPPYSNHKHSNNNNIIFLRLEQPHISSNKINIEFKYVTTVETGC